MKKFIFSWMEKFGIPVSKSALLFAKNTGLMTVGRLLEHFLSYLIIIIISRNLGAEGLGEYSFIFSLVGFFFIFADMGLSTLMMKKISNDFNFLKSYFSSIWISKILLSFISTAVLVFFILLSNKSYLLLEVLLVALINILLYFSYFPINILRVLENARVLWLVNFGERILAFALILFFLLFKSSLLFILFALVISQLIRVAFLIYYTRNYFVISSWSFTQIFDLIKQSFPFVLIAAFTLIYIQIDSIMLFLIKGDAITGLYNSSYKLINIFNLIPTLLLVFGFPLFSKNSKNVTSSRKILFIFLLISFIVFIPFFLFLFFKSGWILNLIYGFVSSESITSLRVLLVAQLFVIFTTIIGQFIAAVEKQSSFAKISAFGAGLNLILNFILIYPLGMVGAAISTTLTYFLMFVIMLLYLRKKGFLSRLVIR